jgi:hypothetical protein
MVCLVVQVDKPSQVKRVKRQLKFRFPILKYITDFTQRRIILYRFDENTTNELMRQILDHRDIIAVMVDDFNFLEDPYF